MVFYHCCLTPNLDHACRIIQEQVGALKWSGLLESCDEFLVGLNGDETDYIAMCQLLPDKASLFLNPRPTWKSCEVPTLQYLDEWLDSRPDCDVCYHHIKGVSHVPGSLRFRETIAWRRCMQNHVICNWEQCVNDLHNGFESVGVHWHTPKNTAGIAQIPNWGGNFWWARSEFLKTLPKIDITNMVEDGRFEAEVWIGRGKRPPYVRDYVGLPVWRCPHT